MITFIISIYGNGCIDGYGSNYSFVYRDGCGYGDGDGDGYGYGNDMQKVKL